MTPPSNKPTSMPAVRHGIRIYRISGRSVGGRWVKGTILQYRFVALVFPEHAVVADYEMGQSRISKLCLSRSVDDAIVFSWDRGLDGVAAEPDAQRAVEVLGRVLAKLIYLD